MFRFLTTIASCLALLVGLDGCSSRPTRFYILTPMAVETSAPLSVSVSVGPVSIPAVLDNPTIMLTVGPNELRADEFARWASPLPDNIARAVAGNLIALLGTPRVLLASETSGPNPDYRVGIAVERVESVVGQDATLDAVWTVRKTTMTGTAQSGRTIVREASQGSDVNALAAAHSRAVERLSADIAAAIRALASE
jgi:uncharacterized protein